MSWLACRAVRSFQRGSFRSLHQHQHQHQRWQQSRQYAALAAAELQFGQPLHETHPHLLKAGEITPGITAVEYYHRRQKLAELLPVNSVAILAAGDVKYRSGSSAVFYDFHQDPDFLYLTGFLEPEALAVIAKKGKSASDVIFHLFVRPKNAADEQWEGARSGVQAALDVFNADEAGDINRVDRELPKLLQGVEKVYTDLPRSFAPRTAFSRYLSGLALRPDDGIAKAISGLTVRPLRPLLNRLRVRKSEAEISLMRSVGKASGRAITRAMRQTWTSEKKLAANLEFNFMEEAMDGVGYVPVVAGGVNALNIHYTRNDCLLETNDLILIDAGAQHGGYITDISRTWPNNGIFAPAQKDLYLAVLSVQRHAVSQCRANANLTLDKIHENAERMLKENLKDLGFDVSGNAMGILFPHHIGHYIGLDVHDSPGFPRTETLERGMCVTIEPGVYVPAHDPSERWPKHFRGMGIRIEDSVCVDSESPFILSTEAVKEVEDIEALRR
ncbi:uncharacterized protein PV09_04527 [Verruconis gallopava]|uniref:Xaa-Pro aminopeptidase n=1 Tax=Verruconis gallopava TaxID=253628 RepID=A0A0D2ACK3_9PEZI|nr:uncharacterized protein PV09_04527 [Verruconis gallopava]KIW04220.1 hypothetical protein PV09_04527 [Verruconis gallopava]